MGKALIEMHPSGDLVNLEDPNPDTIHIEDIAHHLSMICRYNGAPPKHYSVAEHCVLLSKYVEEMPQWGNVSNFNVKWNDCMTMLLHDSSEAYMGDWAGPMLNIPIVHQAWERMNFVLNSAISVALNHRVEKLEYMDTLDASIILDERKHVLEEHGNNWGMYGLSELKIKPQVLDAASAEEMFLEHYYYLHEKINGENVDDIL